MRGKDGSTAIPAKRCLRLALFAGLLGALLFLTPAPAQRLTPFKNYTRRPPRGVQYLKEVENRIYRQTNEARRQNGLPSLDREESLVATARAHSADMLRRKFFSHVNPDGLTPQERVLPTYTVPVSRTGENLWMGSGQDLTDKNLLARLIVDSWLSSPGHRQNLLNPDYTHMGVGVAVVGKEIRATQLFVREGLQ
jgi:uncharacterized protein YkwD